MSHLYSLYAPAIASNSPDSEYREIRRMAHSRHLSIAEWVRNALAVARHHEPLGNASRKLEVIRAATRYHYPTGEIGRILEEIESG